MRRFIKTVVPADGYEEVSKVGEKYVVHLEGVADEQGDAITCYECMTDEVPDMEVLRTELQTWKAYIAERELDTAKAEKIRALKEYDASDAVNSFLVNGVPAWIDAPTRSNYRGSLSDCELLGVTDIQLPIAGRLIPMTVADARVRLARVQLYADQCTIVTKTHEAAIQSLGNVREVEGYDFTAGYPPKLSF